MSHGISTQPAAATGGAAARKAIGTRSGGRAPDSPAPAAKRRRPALALGLVTAALLAPAVFAADPLAAMAPPANTGSGAVPLPPLSDDQRSFFETMQNNELRRQELDSELKVKELERKLEELGTSIRPGTAHDAGAGAPTAAVPVPADFALLSTFGDTREMLAVIAVRGGGQVTVRSGDMLPGDWKVARVDSYRVRLSRAGAYREIVFGDVKK